MPSFLGDHVDITDWIDSEGGNYHADDKQVPGGISQIKLSFSLFFRMVDHAISCRLPLQEILGSLVR